jgi:glycosyltransferase involved in cell wall biosynthesis
MKKRIAVWMHGGVGTGHFSQGYPALEKLLVGLASSFEIVIYSQFATNRDYRSSEFSIRSAPVNVRISLVRWFYLILYFFKDHRKNKFDLLLGFWGYPAGFLATGLSKIVNIPSAVYLLGSDAAGIESINFGILHKPITRRIALWTYNHTTLLLGISEFQKEQLSRYGVDEIKIIPWGVDRNAYKFVAKKTSSTLHIIHVAHLTPVKDQVTLLKAFALIAKQRPAELRIFGEDFLEGYIQKLCKELSVESQVQFLHVIPYQQMPEQYAWADLMLHTSISEGQSMALTEGAATGVLLAGTKVGLLYDLGEDCGITVEVGDYETLASNVLSLLKDYQSWNQKIHNAQQWAETHDLTWTVNELGKCLHSLLKND